MAEPATLVAPRHVGPAVPVIELAGARIRRAHGEIAVLERPAQMAQAEAQRPR